MMAPRAWRRAALSGQFWPPPIGLGRAHPADSARRQMAALDQGAARRLREALDVLAGGELPECPVCKPPRPRAPSTHPPTAHSNCTRILLQA